MFRCSLTMACSTNAEEFSSNSDFDSFLSQLIDKDFNDILSDYQLDLPVSTLAAPNRSNETQLHPRFAEPKTDSEVELAKASGVPKNTARTTTWCITLWNEWRKNRKYLCNDYPPPPQLCTVDSLNLWLCRFILEARRKDGSPYPPRTLYSISCGILRHVREVNFFKDPEFDGFRRTLDNETIAFERHRCPKETSRAIFCSRRRQIME